MSGSTLKVLNTCLVKAKIEGYNGPFVRTYRDRPREYVVVVYMDSGREVEFVFDDGDAKRLAAKLYSILNPEPC